MSDNEIILSLLYIGITMCVGFIVMELLIGSDEE